MCEGFFTVFEVAGVTSRGIVSSSNELPSRSERASNIFETEVRLFDICNLAGRLLFILHCAHLQAFIVFPVIFVRNEQLRLLKKVRSFLAHVGVY